MKTFNIDFFELSFLAETCIPPRPIARTMFWQNLTNVYWDQMSESERSRLFEWLNRNPQYPESLEKEEDTKVFHARFDPENQYMVKTNYNGEQKEIRAFKFGGRYYTGLNTFIFEDYISEVTKYVPIIKY